MVKEACLCGERDLFVLACLRVCWSRVASSNMRSNMSSKMSSNMKETCSLVMCGK
jgi:hypothetical protein